jgi:hypothetical protein
MGQSNSKRIHYEYMEPATPNFNGLVHTVSCTKHFRVGDVVDFVDVDANGNIISVIAENENLVAVVQDQYVISGSGIATGGITGTLHIRPQPIDDVKEALDRLYCDPITGPGQFNRIEPLISGEYLQNYPSGGQTLLCVDDTSFFSVGDTVYIYDNEGFDMGTYNILAVDVNADDSNFRSGIVIDGVPAVHTASPNVFIQNTSITSESAIKYLQAIQDEIDKPVENEDLGVGNGTDCAFETNALFVQDSSKLFIDGRRLKKGTAGTRADHTEGVGNAELTFDSLLLGVLGNEIEVQIVSGAGLAVTVTKSYSASSSAIIPGQTQYLIQVEDSSGAATATQIASAINNDPAARRLVQVRTSGGDGSGTVSTFGPTNLTGGADDGDGDYAEIEQIIVNDKVDDEQNINTGYKWISLHMRPNERNRLSEPPADDEELCIDYRQARSNVDR